MWQEDGEEDVRSYWMTLRTGEDTLIWKRRLWIALCGGVVLEEALDLSSERILNKIRCENFEVTEELAGIYCMGGCTTRKKSTVKWESLWIKWAFDFTNFVAVCNVGAQAICRKNVAVSLLEEFIRKQISKHLQVLCSRVFKFEHLMWVAVFSVNYLFPRGVSWRGRCQLQWRNLSRVCEVAESRKRSSVFYYFEGGGSKIPRKWASKIGRAWKWVLEPWCLFILWYYSTAKWSQHAT